MNFGYVFIVVYILLLGIGTFLQKFSLKEITPFQLEFLVAVVMILFTPVVLFISQKSLTIPIKDIPVGIVVGILFVIGSLSFTLSLTKLSAPTATALSLFYLAIVFLLSVFFHQEKVTIGKILGIILMLAGAVLLVK